jgi:uncharacterized protein YndB with AHSA1/START domain
MTLKMDASGETGVILTRTFAAPPERLFPAWTTPDLIRRWMLGPDGWQMTECRTDPVPGGTFHYAYRNADGRGFTISGTYVTVETPRLIRHREVMAMPEGSTKTDVETRFQPDGDGTLMKVALGYASAAIRDAVLDQNLKAGMEAGYARLDALLAGGPNASE